MGNIIYDAASTVNGYIADAAHSLDWLFAVEGGDAPEAGMLPAEAAVLVEGSRTYEWILEQEGLLERPERWQEIYGETPTYVFTSRELPVPAGADVRFVSGEVADALPQLREAAGEGNIWIVGGGELAGKFFEAGALDRISVSVAPVFLEAGAPYLPLRIEADRLRLLSAAQHGQFARLHYEVVPVTE